MRRVTTQANAGLVNKYIGTAYDTVKKVADNLELLMNLSETADMQAIMDAVALGQTQIDELSLYASITTANYEAIEEVFGQFDELYLGAKDADPTVDNNGNPLIVGAVYWDTRVPSLKYYSGTDWLLPTPLATGAAIDAAAQANIATEQANLAIAALVDVNEAAALIIAASESVQSATTINAKELQFLDNSAYMVIAPLAVSDSVPNILACTVTFPLRNTGDTVYDIPIAVTSDGAYCGITSDKVEWFQVNTLGQRLTQDITDLDLGGDGAVALEIRTIGGSYPTIKLVNPVNGASTPWIASDSTLEWERLFGGITGYTGGVGLAVEAVNYYAPDTDLTYTWDILYPVGVDVANDNSDSGVLVSDQWAVATAQVYNASVLARNVVFDPTSTAYPSSATDVDSILRNIDKEFVRTNSVGTTDDDDDYTVLPVYRTWLADTSTPRNRFLPANPNDADWVIIRDDTGEIVVNDVAIHPIVVGRNGNTIMGLEEDLVFNTNWTWAKVQWFASRNDWRVVEGGVGGQVKIVDTDLLERIYPIDFIIKTANGQNPADYLQFGVWQQIGMGLLDIGHDVLADVYYSAYMFKRVG